MHRLYSLLLALVLGVGLSAGTAQADKLDAEQLVQDAEFTVQRMWDHPEFSEFVRQYLRQSKAVVIIPTMLKGGFFIGGEGGTGVLMARAQTNEWSYPSFLSAGSASIGLQIGGQASEMMLIIMTSRGLQAVLNDQVQIGGEVSGAVGPYGSGAEAATTTNLDADIIAYSIAKGAFLGINIEGTALMPRDSLNSAYYGREATPSQIVLEGTIGNPHADSLRALLQKLVSQ